MESSKEGFLEYIRWLDYWAKTPMNQYLDRYIMAINDIESIDSQQRE